MLSAVSALIIIIMMVAVGCAGSDDHTARTAPLELLEDTYFIPTGGQMALDVGSQAGQITWKSSDARVVRVDSAGVVTAQAAGVATVTACIGEQSDSAVVFVDEDIITAAGQVVGLLAEGCNDERLHIAECMMKILHDVGKAQATNVRNVILNIVSYISGGDRQALEQAITASGFNGGTCRMAAACCWAYGEQLSCDGVISFVGDCTFGRYNESGDAPRFPAIYAASGSKTYPFDRVKGLFACDDLTLINFEGTLTQSTKHFEKSFFFRGEPEYAEILTESGVEAANMANNHVYDYYQRGYDDTKMHLTAAGVAVVERYAPLTFSVGDKQLSVALIAECSATAVYSEEMHASLLAAIKQHKSAGSAVIVNLHWGAEGEEQPAEWQVMIAHELIDGGADMIVGHHSHVMQGIEIYNGKYIAYSIGNFSFGGNSAVSWPDTMILRARLGFVDGEATVTGISVIPCRTTSSGSEKNNYQPMPCFGLDGDAVYAVLLERSRALGELNCLDRPDI